MAFKPLHDQRGLADIARALRQAAQPAAAQPAGPFPTGPAQPAAPAHKRRRTQPPAEPQPPAEQPPAQQPPAELPADTLTFRDFYVARFMDGFADDLDVMQKTAAKDGQPLDVRLLVESIRAGADVFGPVEQRLLLREAASAP